MRAFSLDSVPGYRRRFRVTPAPGRVQAELEDDYHCMGVALQHDGTTVTAVEAVLLRAPWSTCPGAVEQVRRTFTGVRLNDFAARGEKNTNCTHLHDLALLAAAHAADAAPRVYDVLVSDPIDHERHAELRVDGVPVLTWVERNGQLIAPAELAGLRLDQLRGWIDSLPADLREGARILRWGAMVAHGRTIPLERQSDARRMPPNCYTFQPERAVHAQRIGVIRDFSPGQAHPLAQPVLSPPPQP